MGSITSANAVLLLNIPSLYASPQQLQGFSADDVYDIDPLEAAEVMMGVDGILSGGFVYVPVRQAITLQADSPTNLIFENWWTAQQQIKDLYFATGTITLSAVQRKYTMNQGILTTYPAAPDAAKTLRPRKYTITWQSIIPAPYSTT